MSQIIQSKPSSFVANKEATPAAMRVIWSCCETGGLDEDYVLKVIDRAAKEGVSGVELVMRSVDQYVSFAGFPELAAAIDPVRLRERTRSMRTITEHAAERGVRVGVWHHEVSGPDGCDLLACLPSLRAADGLIDLDNPLLCRFIREKVGEFLDQFPAIAEIVLTLTETAYPVAHRPFTTVPVAERIRRVLEAVAAATEPRNRQLVIRPFSALRQDELDVREAVQSLEAKNVSMMYKTEPFDWHPFLPDEELIGSIPKYEARAETDAGAEYYGQGVFPACYTRHIEKRLESARNKHATVAVIRVDRGSHHPSLDHPINEANIIVPTRWCMSPEIPLAEHFQAWLEKAHGVRDEGLGALFERTFNVIKHCLYIDGQSISHHLIPTLSHAKHIQVFALFEENAKLDYLADHWSMLPDRIAPTHAEILKEKKQAVDLARQIAADFDRMAASMKLPRRDAISESLHRLEYLASACDAICRTIAAHTAEMWKHPHRASETFDIAAANLRALAKQVEKRFGLTFFPTRQRNGLGMAECLRDIADGLVAERQLEIPLRSAMESWTDVVDYVLCGFAAEGHRLRKRLHTGDTFPFRDRYVRSTGDGPEQGFTYHLMSRPHRKHTLSILLADDGKSQPGVVRVQDREYPISGEAFDGFREMTIDLPPGDISVLAVRFWSSTPAPLWVARLALSGAL